MSAPAHLLVSLGTSPAIVPEAFLLPGADFQAVHVLTTARPDVGLVREFFQTHHRDVALHITRVEGFEDFRDENDHFHFEEVLYRWVLDTDTAPGQRWFCLSGGFKTMSAAMQKAAAVLGAAEVFHVLADNCCTTPDGKPCPPSTIPQILEAHSNGQLHHIRLGPESGWPQLRNASRSEYPLETVRREDSIRWVRGPDMGFRTRLREIVERSHRIAGAWKKLPELPFPELATWSDADLSWLNQPLNPDSASDRDWVARLPKTDLHCHLGGFATSGHLLDQVRGAAEKPKDLPALRELPPPPRWPLPTAPVGLEAYRHLGDNNGSALLRDPGCLRQQCRLLYEHLRAQNILYAEIRCSPANYAGPHRSPWEVLRDIRNTFQAAMEQAPGSHVNLLLIGTRQSRGDYRAGISRHLALALTAAEHWTCDDECRVVGVDLAGYEDTTTRAHYFREEFTAIHRCGLALTVHAGENDDAEGVWRAVFDLNARRLGHALSLAQSPELLRSVADRGIGVEMCPFANLQIKGFPLDPSAAAAPEAGHYPLLHYLRAGVKVTVNTDNIGISAASLTDNLLLAARLCPGITRLDILRLQRHALDCAFLPACGRRRLTRRFELSIPRP